MSEQAEIVTDDVERMVRAVTLGAIADEEFALACEAAGLNPHAPMTSPLLALALAAASADEESRQ